MSTLRITDTNSANDSKGRAFGLEGNDFIYIIAGFVASLGFYIVLSIFLGCGKLSALLLASPFLLSPLAWILLLKHNRPDGYAEDWFDHTFGGHGWALSSNNQLAAKKP